MVVQTGIKKIVDDKIVDKAIKKVKSADREISVVICPNCRNYVEINTGEFLSNNPIETGKNDAVQNITGFVNGIQRARLRISKTMSILHSQFPSHPAPVTFDSWREGYQFGAEKLKQKLSNWKNEDDERLVYYNCNVCGVFGFLPKVFLTMAASSDLRVGNRFCSKEEWKKLIKRLNKLEPEEELEEAKEVKTKTSKK